MRRQIIIDTETTGLSPEIHEVWELGAIELSDGQRTEHLWRMKPELEAADPGALQVGGYYERTSGMWEPLGSPHACDLARKDENHWSDPAELALTATRLLDGATLIAANPAFDAGFLAQFLRDNRQAPAWHYRLRDIGSMAYGWLSGRNTHEYARAAGRFTVPPADASTDEFARALGVDPNIFERHSALGDCRLVLAMLDAITGGTP
jgi:DNA polymerase III epsilon subunit-like protein